MVQTKDGRYRANGIASPTRRWAALFVAFALTATSASAQMSNTPVSAVADAPQAPTAVEPTGPAPAAEEQAKRPVPLKRSPANPAQTPQTRVSNSEGPATWRIVAALAVVLGTIFGLRWIGRRYVTGQGSSRASRAVQVISRTVVSPKQQLMLVQVGRRLVLVGNSGTSMAPLCEISDGEEVTELLGQVHAEKSESIGKAFGSLFRREEEKYDEPEEPAETEKFPAEHDRDIDPGSSMGTSREELSELLNKVRGMKSQFRQ